MTIAGGRSSPSSAPREPDVTNKSVSLDYYCAFQRVLFVLTIHTGIGGGEGAYLFSVGRGGSKTHKEMEDVSACLGGVFLLRQRSSKNNRWYDLLYDEL